MAAGTRKMAWRRTRGGAMQASCLQLFPAATALVLVRNVSVMDEQELIV